MWFTMIRRWTFFSAVFVSVIGSCICQEKETRPTFPDAFQVEIQGVFLDQKKEMDGAMYYDKLNNRVAVLLTYQKENRKFIYNFDDDEQLEISGNECTVTQISQENGAVFFPITTKGNKKVLSSPEDVFYFTNSTLDRQDLISDLPAYVYTAKVDFPLYERKGCDVTHIFTKPEMETPDCEDSTCKSILISISVRCMDEDGTPVVSHSYSFYRFRTSISDTCIFQVPVGVFCDVKSHKPFPALPPYLSFYYELVDERNYETAESSVYSVQKRIWYDFDLKLIRMDEFDNDGLLMTSRIYDFYGGTSYTVMANLPECVPGPINEDVALDEMTRLPKIIFSNKTSDYKTVYVGTRKVNGLDYETWSLSHTDDENEAKIVQEFYFSKIEPKDVGQEVRVKISHAGIYTYQKDDTSGNYEIEVLTYLKISNFRSNPKEWEAFDISSCYTNEARRGFRLKVDGPPTVKDSGLYETILEKMYMRLIITTNVSVVRINELTGLFDGVHITEFTGWILEKPIFSNKTNRVKEPDMNEAYTLIETAAANGKLNFKIKKDGLEMKYVITDVEEKVEKNCTVVDQRNCTTTTTTIEPPTDKCNSTCPAEAKGRCFSGGSMAASSMTLFVIGIILGLASYYVFLKRRRSRSDDTVKLNPMGTS